MLDQRILLRRRLFSLLDKMENASAVWLSGPAGSGKTSLIASYLADRKIPAMWYRIDTDDMISQPSCIIWALQPDRS